MTEQIKDLLAAARDMLDAVRGGDADFRTVTNNLENAIKAAEEEATWQKGW